MTSDDCSFGALLQTLRRRQHLTQQELAEAIGLHRRTLVRWEQGDTLPQSKALVLELVRHLKLNDQETHQLLEASLTALTPYWSVPFPRNPFFTGREEILDALHRQLSGNKAVALTQSSALHGLGGMGKTQIALEYAYQYVLEYSAVFWIGAETEEQIIASLLHIAEALQLPERDEKDQQRVVAAMQRWFLTHNQWLLIWDNVEDLDLLDHFLPPTWSGAILITTRCRTLGTRARDLELLSMKHEEGILFLLRRAKELSPEATDEQIHQFAERMPSQYAAAAELVMALGGLPLALDQAGAYIEETGCGLPGYLQRYKQQQIRLLDQRGGSNHHPHSVAATFRLALARVEREQPAAGDMLRICAFLHADAIPEEVFVEGAVHIGPAFADLAGDPLQFDRLLAFLGSLSLVQRQVEMHTISLHRLVQMVLRESLEAPLAQQWNERTIQMINAAFPEPEFVNWAQCERCVSHAQMSLQIVEEAGRSVPKARDLFLKAGRYLLDRGRYTEAERFLAQAYTIGEQQRENDLVAARTLNRLATLYWLQGKYQQAEPLFQRALTISEQHLGPDHPETAGHVNDLALLYVEQGNYTQAERLQQHVLTIFERQLEPLHPDLALICDNMARTFSMQGKYTQAEQLYQRALTIWEGQPGPPQPDMTFSLNNLGCLYMEQGKYKLAEPLFQRALTIRQQCLGPDHAQTAISQYQLARLFLRQDKYDEAVQLAQRALFILEQRAETRGFYLASALETLGVIYLAQNRYEQAEPLFMRTLTIQEQQLGSHHPDIAHTLHDFATLRQKQSRLSEAITLAERALSIRSQSLGDTHKKTIATRALYAELVQEQRRLAVEASSSEQQSDQRTMLRAQEHLPIHTINVVVRGANDQVAYTRTVKMREVTFTCTICGQTVTQQHYPSGRIKYCSEACRAINATQMQGQRVTRQREKRQREREVDQ